MEVGENAAQILHGRVSLESLPQGILLLKLGRAENSLVFFDQSAVALFMEALERVSELKPRGLVICGADAEIFSLGLDPAMLSELSDSQAALRLCAAGQVASETLEKFPFPTVCAISGPCLGAGFELALACRWRIISSQKSSVVGLPGMKAGILPAFGGTTRLLKLAGLPLTARLLLEEDVLRPAQALRTGLVDEVSSVSELLEKAIRMVVFDNSRRRNRMYLIDRFLTNTKPGRRIARRRIEGAMEKSRRNRYPASRLALGSIFAGLEHGNTIGVQRQAEAFAASVTSAECHAALRIGFLAAQAAAFGRQAEQRVRHLRAVVAGAGDKGSELAACFARHNCAVLLKDSDESNLQRARLHVLQHLSQATDVSDQEKSFLFNRLEINNGDPGSEGNAGFAIDAVAEDVQSGKDRLRELAALIPQDALLATSSLTYSASDIAAGLPCPERILGMHFVKPAESSNLVEIVRARQTSDRTLVMAAALAVRLGKTPVVVKDSPGLLTERLCSVLYSEALLALEQHSMQDIEAAMLSFGMRRGPFEVMDEKGLEDCFLLHKRLKECFGARFDGLERLEHMLAMGRKGKRARSGFYDYQNTKRTLFGESRSVLGFHVVPHNGGDTQAIQERMILRLLNEAVYCLDEGVAGRPGKEAAEQIDLASVLGVGFPVFRGGLLYHFESIGAAEAYRRLVALKEKFGERFLPSPGLELRSERKRSFYTG